MSAQAKRRGHGQASIKHGRPMAPMEDGMTTPAHTPVAGTSGRPQPARLAVHHALRLGIIGAGQLARMTAMAAAQLGCDVVAWAAREDEPACALATRCVIGDRDDGAKLAQLASQVDRHFLFVTASWRTCSIRIYSL